MVVSRLGTGTSDPVSFVCTCPAQAEGGGTVLLFYRYFHNEPSLPEKADITADRVQGLAAWHTEITDRLEITGKIRIALEGFNITVGGTRKAIEHYIDACVGHWSFLGLSLTTQVERDAFFKPSHGCACVFQPAQKAFVRMCEEITPLGITNYAPASWEVVEELPPAEFHRRCHQDQVTLLDLRNHYESRIGYFINPRSRELAVRPQIRRFSQWPQYFKTHHAEWKTSEGQAQLLTYCTGGIRCEKATRWMAEYDGMGSTRVATLKGGIAAYLDWLSQEIACGRKTPQESLFKGKNYVFDARGAMGLESSTQRPVSTCHICGCEEDRLSKCKTLGCHLVLVVCLACEQTISPTCCKDCGERSVVTSTTNSKRKMCRCEMMREASIR